MSFLGVPVSDWVALTLIALTAYNTYLQRKTEKSINGMHEAALTKTDVASRAEGMAAGKLEERSEVADRKKLRDDEQK